MANSWASFPRKLRLIVNTDRLIEEVEKSLRSTRQVKKGGYHRAPEGAPIYREGTTNLLKAVRIF
jgi:hypothetical protein